jgi:hypothetical protein
MEKTGETAASDRKIMTVQMRPAWRVVNGGLKTGPML